MGDENSLTGKVGLDTTNFKANVTELNREMRVVESRFRATAAGMTDWGKSASGLELRISSLTTKMGLQEKKIKNLTEEYKQVAKEKGATSRAAQDLEIKIYKEVEALGKMEREANNAKDELKDLTSGTNKAGNEVKELGDKSDHATGKMGSFKGAIQGLGGVLKATIGIALGLAAAVGGIIVAVAGLAAKTIGPASDLAETLSKTKVVFEGNAEAVIKFGEEAALHLGMSENAALSAAAMYGNLFRAMGIGTQASADMSINLVTLAGDLASFNNMDPTEVLEKLRAGLTGEAEPLKVLGININEATLKAKALELGLWDGKSALDAGAKAQAAYALMLEQSSLAHGDFSRTSDGLANQQRILAAKFENTKAVIGTAFLPIVTEAAGALSTFLDSTTFTGGLETLVGWIGQLGKVLEPLFSENPDFSAIGEGLANLVGDVLGSLSGMVPQIVTMITSMMPILIENGLKILQSILNGITQNLPMILKAVIGILKSLLGFLVENLPMILDAGIEILLTLVTAIIDALPMLIDAALQMIITLALGIAEALPTLIPAVVEALVTVVTTLIENIPMLYDAALQLLLGLAKGILSALPVLIKAAPKILIGLVEAIIQSLPILIEMTPQMLGAIVIGIIEALPILAEAALEIILAITRAVMDLTVRICLIGEDIVKGIWQGILTKKDWFFAEVKKFFLDLIVKVKEALGIASPSKLFADEIGVNIPGGIGAGIMKGMPALHKQLSAAMRGLTGTAELAFNGSMGAGGVGSSINNSRNYQYVNHISNAGIDASELARIQRRQELLYGT